MPEQIEFICDHCEFRQWLPANTAGMPGKCPSCKANVIIPYHSPTIKVCSDCGTTLEQYEGVKCKVCQAKSSQIKSPSPSESNRCPVCGFKDFWNGVSCNHCEGDGTVVNLAPTTGESRDEIADDSSEDDESTQESASSNVIGTLVVLGIFCVAAFFVRNWAIDVDGELGLGGINAWGWSPKGWTSFLCFGGFGLVLLALPIMLMSGSESAEFGCGMFVLVVSFLMIAVGSIIAVVVRLNAG